MPTHVVSSEFADMHVSLSKRVILAYVRTPVLCFFVGNLFDDLGLTRLIVTLLYLILPRDSLISRPHEDRRYDNAGQQQFDGSPLSLMPAVLTYKSNDAPATFAANLRFSTGRLQC
jgi:hypothetical protein